MTTIAPSAARGTHTKTKGDIAEAFIIARLLEKGMTVLRPVGDNARYDLVIQSATPDPWPPSR